MRAREARGNSLLIMGGERKQGQVTGAVAAANKWITLAGLLFLLLISFQGKLVCRMPTLLTQLTLKPTNLNTSLTQEHGYVSVKV